MCGTFTAGQIQFSFSVFSGSAGQQVVITVLRVGGALGPASVQFTTVESGDAVEGVDYTAVSQTITFDVGNFMGQTITIDLPMPNDDTRTFSVEISDPTGATLGSVTTATVSITPTEYEETASVAVNIDAKDFGQTSVGPPNGTVISINTLTTDRVIITKPALAIDAGLIWDAWSAWANDTGNGDNLAWLNFFRVADQTDTQLLAPNVPKSANIAAALAAVQPYLPIQLTGKTEYQFWMFDSPIAENRGGLSLRVKVYSLPV